MGSWGWDLKDGINWDFGDTHGPLPLKKSFYPKLPNTRSTIPRNTAASKSAIGPLNKSEDKTITVLTP